MSAKRTILRGVAVLSVALAAGHLVQSMAGNQHERQYAHASPKQRPKDIVQLAAGPATEVVTPVLAQPAKPLPEKVAAPKTVLPKIPTAEGAAVLASIQTMKVPVAEDPEKLVEACPVRLDLSAEPSAMIGVMLVAPCKTSQRVVLKHGGLVVTLRTSDTGLLLADMPAMDASGTVEAVFADGTNAKTQISIPDATTMRRFAVQWGANDAFQIQAYENDAAFGQPGNISAAAPHNPGAGTPASGGFLTVLGDPDVTSPLLAQVYSFPVDPSTKAEVTVEAAVTPATCGREMIGETVMSAGGKSVSTDLSLAMPDCDAVGDYLVLNILVPDLSIASAN